MGTDHNSNGSTVAATEASPLASESGGKGSYTLTEGLVAAGLGRYQVLRLLIACGVTVCSDAMEGMLLPFLAVASQLEWNLSPLEAGSIFSVVFAGQLAGGVFWGVFSDLFGRRTGYFFAMITTLTFGLLSAASQEYWQMLVARGMVGFGISGSVVAYSLYGEFIPSHKGRVWIMSPLFVFVCIGGVAVTLLAWATLSTLGWRMFLILAAMPSVVALMFFSLMPESPRWLVYKNKLRRAENLLSTVAKWNRTKLPEGRLAGNEPEECEGPWEVLKELMKGEWLWSMVILSFVKFVMGVGYYGISIYTVELMRADGADRSRPQGTLDDQDYIDMLISAVGELPGLFFVIVIMEWLGRKASMVISMGLFSVCMLAFMLDESKHRFVQLALIFVGRAAIGGILDLIYLYEIELFPTKARTMAMGIIFTCSRVGALMSGHVVEGLMIYGRGYPGLCMGVLGAAAAVLAALLPRETKGRDLVETLCPCNSKNTSRHANYNTIKTSD